uniref:SBP-type domain-containing protein n=2 Tax=Lactuca sativa TaxID=4236 RepID=A0A9R1XK65_LACSA|nr:hypothetical protein LSAT_V11C300113360 [Lactuca sativa]
MEWNTKWDWESLDISSPKKLQSTDWGIKEGEDIDGCFSLSDIGNKSSAKSSISESSLKEVVIKGSNLSFPNASVCSSDQSIGLKLGKRTYFENNLPGGNNTKTSSSSNTPVKKVKFSSQNTPIPRCQVEGCNLDLSSAKEYHRKHRVCENHSKSLKVVVSGLERRFCQQCSRFHGLSEFDGKKRSCRRRLSDHNTRRRKPQQSRNLSSSFYEGGEELSFVFNNQNRHGGHNRVTHSLGTQFPNDVSNSMPTLAFNRMMSSKGISAGVFDQGSDAGHDIRRALSLLSNDSWDSCEVDFGGLNQPMHRNGPTMAQHGVHVAHHGLPFSSPEYRWQVDHQSVVPHTHFEESHLLKAPYSSIQYGNPMDEILKPL